MTHLFKDSKETLKPGLFKLLPHYTDLKEKQSLSLERKIKMKVIWEELEPSEVFGNGIKCFGLN